MKYLRSNAIVVGAWLLAHLLGVSASAEESPWPTIFRGHAEVNVINVEVVVTDADGRPVSGLGRDDFELFENGKPVEISNFYAVSGGRIVPPAIAGTTEPSAASEPAPAAERGPLYMILYVDNTNIRASNRNRLFRHLREFLVPNWRPDMQVMLVTNDRSLVVHQDFTPFPNEILTALTELAESAPVNPRFDLERRQLIRAIEDINVEAGSGLFATKDPTQGLRGFSEDEGEGEDQEALTRRIVAMARPILTQIRAYSEQRLLHVRETIRILKQLVEMASVPEGQKTVVYISDGLPLQPGVALMEAYARRFAALQDIGANLSPDFEASRDDATREFHDLVTHANTNKVTFYTLDAAPPDALSRGSAASTGSAGGNFASWNDGLAAAEQRDRQETLIMMAEGTGGLQALSTSTLEATLEGIFTDFNNHYSLGYVAERTDDAEDRTIAVKVRREGLRLRHRNSFRDKTAGQRAVEQTQAALWLNAVRNPFGVTLETGAVEPRKDGQFVVPLLAKVPLSKLILLPGESEHQGQVSMFVAVRDDQGRSSGVNRHLCPIRLPNSEVLSALGRTAACGVHLRMRGGPQRVAVSVLDEVAAVSSTTYLALDVGAPGPPEPPPEPNERPE